MLCFGCRSIEADGTISKCRSDREGVATIEEQHSSMAYLVLVTTHFRHNQLVTLTDWRIL